MAVRSSLLKFFKRAYAPDRIYLKNVSLPLSHHFRYFSDYHRSVNFIG